ncbi:hypothetical protein Tco_0875953 [Tanacetum coccineum]|uniref:Tf2-1-like SH3-like domain-containing protein n=1 Tax=Tanacetum coccineum TaxID=301880 RepID=A0ABQ5BTU2_9ASTR
MQAGHRHRQKSYADRKRKPMEFKVGDRVMLKVSPWKGVIRFGKRGKLNPRYVGPFQECSKSWERLPTRLELPQELSRVHHTFHVSNLKKCYADEPIVMPLEGIHVDDKLQFVVEPLNQWKGEINGEASGLHWSIGRVTMSSATSAVTYTSVYTDSEPGRVFWGTDDEEVSEGGIPRVIVLGYDGLPLQPVAPSPPGLPLPERFLEDDETEDGPVDYPMDGGDDGDDDCRRIH